MNRHFGIMLGIALIFVGAMHCDGQVRADEEQGQIAQAKTYRWSWVGRGVLTRKNGQKQVFNESGVVELPVNDHDAASRIAFGRFTSIIETARNVGEQYTANVQVTAQQ